MHIRQVPVDLGQVVRAAVGGLAVVRELQPAVLQLAGDDRAAGEGADLGIARAAAQAHVQRAAGDHVEVLDLLGLLLVNGGQVVHVLVVVRVVLRLGEGRSRGLGGLLGFGDFGAFTLRNRFVIDGDFSARAVGYDDAGRHIRDRRAVVNGNRLLSVLDGFFRLTADVVLAVVVYLDNQRGIVNVLVRHVLGKRTASHADLGTFSFVIGNLDIRLTIYARLQHRIFANANGYKLIIRADFADGRAGFARNGAARDVDFHLASVSTIGVDRDRRTAGVDSVSIGLDNLLICTSRLNRTARNVELTGLDTDGIVCGNGASRDVERAGLRLVDGKTILIRRRHRTAGDCNRRAAPTLRAIASNRKRCQACQIARCRERRPFITDEDTALVCRNSYAFPDGQSAPFGNAERMIVRSSIVIDNRTRTIHGEISRSCDLENGIRCIRVCSGNGMIADVQGDCLIGHVNSGYFYVRKKLNNCASRCLVKGSL